MAFFTFTFREQIFQAQYHVLDEPPMRRLQVSDLPPELEKLVMQDLVFMEEEGVVRLPGWELGDALAFGLTTELTQRDDSTKKI